MLDPDHQHSPDGEKTFLDNYWEAFIKKRRKQERKKQTQVILIILLVLIVVTGIIYFGKN